VQKRAKLIGETTGGGANPGGLQPIDRQIGIAIFVPNGRAQNPVTKTSWEGTGVAPDVAVDERQALRTAVLEILATRHDESSAAIRRDLITQSNANPTVETELLRFRTTALPGSAAAVRRNLEELASGTPNYALMSPDLANVTRLQLPMLQPDISRLGAIKAVTFTGVGPDGYDVYEVTLANATILSGIFVTPDGKIAGAWLNLREAPKPPP
jgi:hypothetical protein